MRRVPADNRAHTFGMTSPKVGTASPVVTRSAGEIPIWVNNSRAAATVSAFGAEWVRVVIAPPFRVHEGWPRTIHPALRVGGSAGGCGCGARSAELGRR